ncbi:ICE family protease (caspase) p20 domain-containing protein [Cardiosporidium cionae]|uniref:ICE family protease (Caspase) p20 domain-containing protein n=1 Tax=Cardiosporidium cionae TaxID=476202 RepID=A0ABQ7JC62_9APIC|nr:ICE family protease (caspase) p20 domain-containing protein [Cardiosporidium cionae]|eukprot:KAF8821561.1 ICE family protease (caspase) p20 domain-containing protein [Cardiosporidium cionae]
MSFPFSNSSVSSRNVIKKAVVIGISYVDYDTFFLEGSANDAALVAYSLVHLLAFDPQNVVLMTDALPSSCYRLDTNYFQLSANSETPQSTSSSESSTCISNASEPVNCKTKYFSNDNSSSKCPRSVAPGSRQSMLTSTKWDFTSPVLPDGEEDKMLSSNKSAPLQNADTPEEGKEYLMNSPYRVIVHPPVKLHKIGKSKPNTCKKKRPTRENILKAINWLVRDAGPGNVLLFYFAGHGLQIDNMIGYEGEGYDEGILPVDFECGIEDNWNVLTTVQLKELLLGIDRTVQLTMILDCNGGQTILDPAGTVNDMRSQYVRPRFIPGISIDSTSVISDPFLMQGGVTPLTAKAYCLTAAPWSQCAIECAFSSIGITHRTHGTPVTQSGKPVIHGVFTHSLITSLKELLYVHPNSSSQVRKGVSYLRLIEQMQQKIMQLRESRLFQLDQYPELTVYTGGMANPHELFCIPFGGCHRLMSAHNNGNPYVKEPYSPECYDEALLEEDLKQNFVSPGEVWQQLSSSNGSSLPSTTPCGYYPVHSFRHGARPMINTAMNSFPLTNPEITPTMEDMWISTQMRAPAIVPGPMPSYFHSPFSENTPLHARRVGLT